MRKGANFSPYMRRPLVIYDFAPDPSEFPYICRRKILFYFFISVGDGLFVEFSEKGQKSRSIGKVDQKGEYIYLEKYP